MCLAKCARKAGSTSFGLISVRETPCLYILLSLMAKKIYWKFEGELPRAPASFIAYVCAFHFLHIYQAPFSWREQQLPHLRLAAQAMRPRSSPRQQ